MRLLSSDTSADTKLISCCAVSLIQSTPFNQNLNTLHTWGSSASRQSLAKHQLGQPQQQQQQTSRMVRVAWTQHSARPMGLPATKQIITTQRPTCPAKTPSHSSTPPCVPLHCRRR
jgi:hypothetical protein